MSDAPDEPFYIGWAPVPDGLRAFLAWIALGLILFSAGAGYLLVTTQDDPGAGAFRWDLGPAEVTGVIEAAPYPILHVTGGDRFAAGETLLLSGIGKRGIQGRAGPLDGQVVVARGIELQRGDIRMLQVGRIGPAEEAPPATPPVPEALGRWRVTGEVCDGKCSVGAMRPGTGLAHKACANLCVIGGVPPVLVTGSPVMGERFLLISAPGGGEVTRRVLDRMAEIVEIEGPLTRRGGLLVLEAETIRDPD